MAQQLLLDAASPQITDIPSCKIALCDHQRAMIRRCLDIERVQIDSTNGHGLMSDAPGTGKTFVLLALVLVLKNAAKKVDGDPGTNVIVVPQHIFGQWVQAAKAFSNGLNVREFNTFADVTSVRDSIRGIDVLLTTREYLPLLDVEGIHRLILDEPPKADETRRRPAARMTWYVSASLRGVQVRENECCCDPSFVTRSFAKANLAFATPDTSFLRCNNVVISRVLAKVLESNELAASFANSYKERDEETLVVKMRKALVEKFNEQAFILDEVAKRRRRLEKRDLDKLSAEHSATKLSLKKMRAALVDAGVCGACGNPVTTKGFRPSCCETDVVCESCAISEKCRLCDSPECAISKLENLPVHAKGQDKNDKIHVLSRLIEKADEKAHVVIVSSHGFEKFRNAFPELDSVTTDDPVAFMSSPTRIFLLDPSIHSCGSNMHAATDVVFYHRISGDAEMQVIGRALRPPRTGRLRVWHLRYDIEHQGVASTSAAQQ